MNPNQGKRSKVDRKKLHRQQVKKQIILPAILIAIIILLLIGLLIFLSVNSPETVKKISDFTIFILIVILILAELILIFMLMNGISKTADWIKKIPEITDPQQGKIESLNQIVDDILKKSYEPMIKVKSWSFALKSILDRKKSDKHE